MSVQHPAIPAPRFARAGFAATHRADALFFPALVAVIWIGILAGFGPRVAAHFSQHKPAYLPILHVHAAVFVGWLLLLTLQLVLVRSHHVAIHRRVGRLGAVWLPLMLVVGLVTSVIVDRSMFGTPRWDPQFLAIQLSDLVLFGVLTASALLLRRDPPSHKRLLLLGTVTIANAGFARWWDPTIAAWLGESYWSVLLQDFSSDFLILGAMCGYDLWTRGRVNRALLRAGALVVGFEALCVYLYLTPAWAALTDRLLRP